VLPPDVPADIDLAVEAPEGRATPDAARLDEAPKNDLSISGIRCASMTCQPAASGTSLRSVDAPRDGPFTSCFFGLCELLTLRLRVASNMCAPEGAARPPKHPPAMQRGLLWFVPAGLSLPLELLHEFTPIGCSGMP
jgi:hypothetical protein